MQPLVIQQRTSLAEWAVCTPSLLGAIVTTPYKSKKHDFIVPPPRPPRPVNTSNNTQQAAQQHAEASPTVGEGSLEELSPQKQDDVWSPDYEVYGDGTLIR